MIHDDDDDLIMIMTSRTSCGQMTCVSSSPPSVLSSDGRAQCCLTVIASRAHQKYPHLALKYVKYDTRVKSYMGPEVKNKEYRNRAVSVSAETDGSRKFGHDMKVNTPREQNIKYNSGNEFLMCPIDVWEMESQSPITFTQLFNCSPNFPEAYHQG